MTEQEEKVAEYYDDEIHEAELVRLTQDFPVEFGITRRWLERYVPEGARVVEIGVGGGHYTELMARRGCRLQLVDVSRKLLEKVADRLRVAGLGDRLLGASHESATALSSLPAAGFDVVVLIGPLYHLCALEDRRRAVAESARVLKRGGLLIAGGINRLAYLRDLFRDEPHQVLARSRFHACFLEDGNLDPEHAPPIGYAHLTGVAEYRALFREGFEDLVLVGVESFLGPWQKKLNDLSPEAAEAWLDLAEGTGATPEGLGYSDHLLYIGRRL